MILPSLLEYSVESLEKKISLLQDKKMTSLHLDFVLPQFAKNRKVMTSLGLQSVIATLSEKMSNQTLTLSLHLMGTSEDLFESYRFFETVKLPHNWNTLVLVPEKYTTNFRTILNPKNIIVGTWYDLGEWEHKQLSRKQTYLLMTVKAGKSGQIRTTQSKKQAFDIAKSYPNSHFIVDGGWSVNEVAPNNTDIVSYSSFWKSIV
jgi:pentose-5-phosphate-3-epimerase